MVSCVEFGKFSECKMDVRLRSNGEFGVADSLELCNFSCGSIPDLFFRICDLEKGNKTFAL